jgi:S-adenosylmethionine-diacylglycerol 3-amino-3-carboxypropyl transferase
MAAFRNLSHSETLQLIGVRSCADRHKLYKKLRNHLSEEGRAYWDKNRKKIDRGLMHAGRYEYYMRLLRRVLILLVGKSTLDDLFDLIDKNTRNTFFNQRWNTVRWKIFTRIFLSRQIMSFLFDKSFFSYLEDSFSFGEHFAKKVAHAIKNLPLRQNYFLSYILRGNYYSEEFLPPYLHAENYEIIKTRIDRIEIITTDCRTFFNRLAPDSISRFNFSNIFEWMSSQEYQSLLKETIRVARDGARLTYRNLLVPRTHPEALAGNIKSLSTLAAKLHQRDMSFIYSNYVIEVISKENKTWNIPAGLYQQNAV